MSEHESIWIDCVLDIGEREPDGDHLTSHAVFCHKVLGETWMEALKIAARFRPHRLSRVECEALAKDWRRCDECGAIVPGGTPRCPDCVVAA